MLECQRIANEEIISNTNRLDTLNLQPFIILPTSSIFISHLSLHFSGVTRYRCRSLRGKPLFIVIVSALSTNLWHLFTFCFVLSDYSGFYSGMRFFSCCANKSLCYSYNLRFNFLKRDLGFFNKIWSYQEHIYREVYI